MQALGRSSRVAAIPSGKAACFPLAFKACPANALHRLKGCCKRSILLTRASETESTGTEDKPQVPAAAPTQNGASNGTGASGSGSSGAKGASSSGQKKSVSSLGFGEDDKFSWQEFLGSDLPAKLGGLVALLLLSRVGVYIRLPGVDVDAFAESLTGSGLLGYIDTLSGGSISKVQHQDSQRGAPRGTGISSWRGHACACVARACLWGVCNSPQAALPGDT